MLACLLALLLLLGPTPSLMAALETTPAETPVLTSFRIMGAQTVSPPKLKDEMTMPLPSWLPWKKPPVFKVEDLERDLERLKNYLRQQGFYHADITPEIQTGNGKVSVTLHITEGPWVKVTQVEVTVTPTEEPVDLSSLKEEMPLNPGDRFTIDQYEALKRRYVDYLADHGHPRGKAEGQVLLDEEQNTARVLVRIDPGPLCYFGPVKIKGELETPEYLILRKLTFKPGDVFSIKQLYDSQRQLYGLDLFQSVTLAPEEGSEQETHIPIVVVLQEKKKRSVKVGMGYGDEDRFRARLALRFRNLGGGGRTVDVDGKHSAIEDRVQGSFTNPQLWGSRNDFVFQTGYLRQYLPGFTDKSIITQERLERDLPWHFRGWVGHGLEFARPFNIPVETLLILSETQTGKLYRASMVLGGLRQETVDNLTDPHRGGIFTVDGQCAPDFLGSNMQFLRGVGEIRRYQALGGTDFILAGRLRCGVIQPIQATTDIPIFRRFFAGGYNSVRGYRLDYLGPRNASGQPVGGEALLEGSFEARIPLYKDFRAVAFLDCGNVFFKINQMDVGQLKYAAGVGLRYQTFIGPLGVEVGFPLNPIDRNQDKYQVHFTIGQAF